MLTDKTAGDQRVRALSQLGSGFLSLITHEVRTPLAAATSSVELMDMRGHAWTPEKRAKVLARMAASLTRIDSILEVVGFAERVAAGRIEIEPERLLVSQVVRDSGLAVDPEHDEKPVLVRRDLLERTLSNLLSYLTPETPNRPRAVLAGRHPSRIVVTIDLGSPEAAARFCTPESRSSSLQLRLATLFAAMDGGSLAVERGEGATVIATINLGDIDGG